MARPRFNQPIRCRRARRGDEGEYVGGIWREGVPEVITLQTSVQPAGDKHLALLPEARRVNAAYALYSRTEVLEGDIVEIYGADYEVLRVMIWQNGVQPHYQAVATKMQARDT